MAWQFVFFQNVFFQTRFLIFYFNGFRIMETVFEERQNCYITWTAPWWEIRGLYAFPLFSSSWTWFSWIPSCPIRKPVDPLLEATGADSFSSWRLPAISSVPRTAWFLKSRKMFDRHPGPSAFYFPWLFSIQYNNLTHQCIVIRNVET